MCGGIWGESFLWWEPGREDRQTVSRSEWISVWRLDGQPFTCSSVLSAGVLSVSPSVRSSSVQRTANCFPAQRQPLSSWCPRNLCMWNWACPKRSELQSGSESDTRTTRFWKLEDSHRYTHESTLPVCLPVCRLFTTASRSKPMLKSPTRPAGTSKTSACQVTSVWLQST